MTRLLVVKIYRPLVRASLKRNSGLGFSAASSITSILSISHDIPFLNSVINIIYHMDNAQLTRYVGDYDQFQEVYAMKKAQLEAAYNKQQREIADLKDFVARNKARVATRNMGDVERF
mgnify:CR=1 FL=1